MIIYNMYQYKYYVYTIVKYIHIPIIVIGRVCPILMAILAWYPSHYHTIFIVFHENENKYCIICTQYNGTIDSLVNDIDTYEPFRVIVCIHLKK